MTPLIIQFIAFWAYVGGMWIYNGKPMPSISDSWYLLPKKHRRLFMLFCLSVAVPIFFQETGLFFASGAFLIFTGIAPEFKETLTKTVHGFGAVGSIGFASAALLVEGMWLPIAGGALISLVLRYSKVNSETWWVEILWFTVIQFGLFAQYLQDSDPVPIVVRTMGVV